MHIRLIAIGTKMPTWVVSGFLHYQKRLTQDITLELVEIEALTRTKQADLIRIKENESNALLEKVHPKHHVVALDVLGISWSSKALSDQLRAWQHQGKPVDLLIGGPEGLSNTCLTRATQKWSLSPLTLPHPLVRIIVAEQLYRAWSMLHNHPYHR